MTTWTTTILAEYVRDTAASRPDSTVAAAAGDVLIDLIGCAAAGHASPGARAFRETADRLHDRGDAAIWFTGDRLCAAGAATANSAAGSALDLDDGHRQAGGHPGAAIVPTVLAVAPQTAAAGREVVAALQAGYEVAVRVSAARDFARLDTLSTGRWSAYGVVAAAGLLARDSATDLATAFAIAGVLSPGLSAAGYSQVMGNAVKEGIPWSVQTGLTALELARRGLTGPLDILDHPDYFDAAAIIDGLGAGGALATVYFKPYACCRWIHAPIDALIDLVAGRALRPDDIRRMDVHTFERALRLNNDTDPDTLEGAQYSLPFCLAVAACGGGEALLPLDRAWLHRPSAVALAEKVHLTVDPELEARFPAETGARICLETAAGRLEKIVRYPLGDPANPMGRRGLTAKFRRLADGVISLENQAHLLAVIDELPELACIDRLVDCLRHPRVDVPARSDHIGSG